MKQGIGSNSLGKEPENSVRTHERKTHIASVAFLATTLTASFGVAADGAYTAELFAQRVTSSSQVGALGDNLFGEQVDWYSGNTFFAVTDVSLPGNGVLPVAVGRTHRVGTQGPVSLGLFGNWDLDIPSVQATFIWNDGWAVAPCSSRQFPPMRTMTLPPPSYPYWEWIFPKEYWDGHRLHIPGSGDKPILLTNAGLQTPQDGKSYPWSTVDNWHLSCIPTKRGAGEGFLARSPDGVRYYFDIAFAREAWPLIMPFFNEDIAGTSRGFGGGGGVYVGDGLIYRQKVYLYPSRMEDRHGNWVEFNWEMSGANDARLNSIVANDGRRIDIGYKWIEPTGVLSPQDASGYKIETVTANNKVWRYGYGDRSLLTTVTLPDTSTWVLSPTYAYPKFVNAGSDPCNGLSWVASENQFEYTMTHPSGAKGKFLFKTTAHGRANVYPKCDWDKVWRRDKNWSPGKLFAAVSLHRKEISGPGMETRVWTVAWNSTPGNDASWQGENQGDTVKTVSIANPSGMFTRYTFSNYFDRDEGKLLKQETGTSSGQILSASDYTYDVDSPTPVFTRQVGQSGMENSDGRVIPLRSAKVTRDGRVFTTAIEAYDQFARPLQIRRSSEPAPQAPPSTNPNPTPDPIEPPPCTGCQVP